MKVQIKIPIALLLAALASAAILAGCGSDSSDSTGDQTETQAQTGAQAEGTASFISSKGSNRIPRFGQEADKAEREAASAVLQKSLEARAASQWEEQCATLTAALVKNFERRAEFYEAGKTCAQGLGYEAQEAPKAVLQNTMSGPIDVLRTNGKRAYALYHGNDGKDYAMPMRLEDGKWYVGEVSTITLPS